MNLNTKRTLVAVGTILCIVVFAITVTRSFWVFPDSGMEVPAGASAAVQIGPAEQPARLQIPSLAIDVKVQLVGVTKAGNMGVPNNFTDVAWYKYGTVPGQLGNAVIDGHVDNAVALPGVFKHLGTINVGDAVYVQTASGSKLHFVVTDVATYPYTQVPIQALLASSTTAHLNLITCGGTWNQSVKSYDQRLVVYTKLVGTEPPA
ncbi:MAG: peptidase sortase [Parcubacteria group bacterium]|nr:peptidase sortase [Parcubacteria group bacterium]